jgi:hypothetical protein
MHTSTSKATAAGSKKMATTTSPVQCAVYSNSRKGVSIANGNGHASTKAPTADTRTVILRPDQAALMLDNNNSVGQLVTVPVAPPKDKVFECPEESLFYCQSIESLVLNRCVASITAPLCPR